MERIRNLTDEQKARYYNTLETRNGMVVEYNPVMTALLGCNTNVSILGSDAQAKSIMAYLLKYMTKSPAQLCHAISVIHSARKHIEKYPSLAEDTGTEQRTAMYFFTRLVNDLSSAIEISTPMACLALLSMPAEIATDSFQMLFASAALAYVLRKGKHPDSPDDFDDLFEYNNLYQNFYNYFT